MRRSLTIGLVAFAVLDLWLLVQLGFAIGGLATFGLLLGGVIAGGSVFRHITALALWASPRPGRVGATFEDEITEPLMLVGAAVLLMVPGVISDVIAAALLVPPVRRVIGRGVQRAFGREFAAMRALAAVSPEGDEGRLVWRSGQYPEAGPEPGPEPEIIDIDPASVREDV